MKLHTETTRSKQAFDALFDGFHTLRAVSYVVAPRILLRFFERGFHPVEIVAGDNLVQTYQTRLAEEPLDATDLFGQAALEDTSGFWAQCEKDYEAHRSFGQ